MEWLCTELVAHCWQCEQCLEEFAAGPTTVLISCLPLQRIAENRRCRDVLFLLFFLGFWIGMVILAGFAWSKGNAKLAA